MKKILASFAILLCAASVSFAGHRRYFTSADDIISGTLPNARLDPSSVTLQGNDVNLADLETAVNAVSVDTASILSVLKSTAVQLSNLQATISTLTVGLLTEANLVNLRQYDVYVGTLGSVSTEVDIASSNVDGLNQALLILKARGLIHSATGYGTIFYRRGVYDISGATIPAGITVYASPKSSTVWVPSALNQGVVTIYGTANGIDFDFGARAYAGSGIVVTSSGTLTNFKIYNGRNMEFSTRMSLVVMEDGSDATISNGHFEGVSSTQSSISGVANSAFVIKNSINSNIKNIKVTSVTHENTSSVFMLVYNTTRVVFSELDFPQYEAQNIKFDGGNYLSGITRSKFNVVGTCALGCIVFGAASTGEVNRISSANFFTDNVFSQNIAAGTNNLVYIEQTVANTWGTYFSGNVGVNEKGSTFRLANLSAGSIHSLLTNNRVSGPGATIITNSGTGTLYQSLGNFSNTKEE